MGGVCLSVCTLPRAQMNRMCEEFSDWLICLMLFFGIKYLISFQQVMKMNSSVKYCIDYKREKWLVVIEINSQKRLTQKLIYLDIFFTSFANIEKITNWAHDNYESNVITNPHG